MWEQQSCGNQCLFPTTLCHKECRLFSCGKAALHHAEATRREKLVKVVQFGAITHKFGIYLGILLMHPS